MEATVESDVEEEAPANASADRPVSDAENEEPTEEAQQGSWEMHCFEIRRPQEHQDSDTDTESVASYSTAGEESLTRLTRQHRTSSMLSILRTT